MIFASLSVGQLERTENDRVHRGDAEHLPSSLPRKLLRGLKINVYS